MLGTTKTFYSAVVCLLLVVLAWGSEVVELNSKTFEHLTQAATGATTGDWLVKFYAPWCGHCKTLAPIYEEVAQELKDVVNVAKVDVMQSRDLGTRFEIQGFPTLLFFSKGHVYTFKGKRNVPEIVAFAKGGYVKHERVKVPEELGWFGEIKQVYKQAYKDANRDFKKGNYFTISVFLMVLPVIFGVLIVILVTLLVFGPPVKPQRARKPQGTGVVAGTSPAAGGAQAAQPEESNKKSD